MSELGASFRDCVLLILETFLPVSDVICGILKGSSRLGGSISDKLWDPKAGAVEGLCFVKGTGGCKVLSILLGAGLATALTGSEKRNEVSREAPTEAAPGISC